MNKININEYLKGEAVIGGTRQIMSQNYCQAGEEKDWRKRDEKTIKWSIDNWDKTISKVKQGHQGGCDQIINYDTESKGMKVSSRLCGGMEVLVTWSDIKQFLIDSIELFEKEKPGEQLSFTNLFEELFYKVTT